MLNLIKIELKKFNFKKYVKSVFIADMIILALLYFIVIVSKTEGDIEFQNYKNIFIFTESLIKATFMVFASTIISKLIIDEYKNKTIYILFTYPISRKKLIISKLILIVIFTFVSILISFLLIFSIFFITESITPIVVEKLTVNMILTKFIGISTSAVSVSFMSLIPLYFGFRKKSVKTTIISSVILLTFLNTGSNGFSLSSVLIVQIILAVLGILSAYLTIKDIDIKDVTV